jgi:lipoprotein-releasing system ATP-binding protein
MNMNTEVILDSARHIEIKPSPSYTPVMECKAVTKEYFEGNNALKILTGINLSIRPGEQVAIMGRSGSGKTTLLQMLGGLDVPTSGSIAIDGKNLKNLNENQMGKLRNRHLGFIYQFHHLLPEFSALENVAMPLLIAKISAKEAASRAAHLLEAVGLKLRLNHKPMELSGGEKQRVAIARALINNPKCVLADEPTGNLDDESAAQVFEVMRSLNRLQNTSIILVTHDASLAKQLDRTLILQGGQLHPQN